MRNSIDGLEGDPAGTARASVVKAARRDDGLAPGEVPRSKGALGIVILVIVAALGAWLYSRLASADVYKWTDSAGRTHYGDHAPDEGKSETLRLPVQSYDGPAQVTDWASIIRARPKATGPAASAGIVMYSTSWCPHCRRARAYFARNAIAYQDIDVEASDANRQAFADVGGGGVPLILVGGKAMRGFDPAAMEALLRR